MLVWKDFWWDDCMSSLWVQWNFALGDQKPKYVPHRTFYYFRIRALIALLLDDDERDCKGFERNYR